jgi:hypothetical protein
MLGSGYHAVKGTRHVAVMQAAMWHEGGLRGMRQLTACCRLLVMVRQASGITAAVVTQWRQQQRAHATGGSGAAV